MRYLRDVLEKAKFLSTLPARGATSLPRRACRSQLISIHAPREGSDEDFRQSLQFSSSFLSTLPARGATNGRLRRPPRGLFLSTLPARGATGVLCFRPEDVEISIHAPREGSDARPPRIPWAEPYFYPRSPRGERPITSFTPSPTMDFYPRSPRGERLCPKVCKVQNAIFLSTLPARGATPRIQHGKPGP